MQSLSRFFLSRTLLLFIITTIVVIQSNYVGDLTIYSPEKQAHRYARHYAVLSNTPIGEKWGDKGDNGVNTRILSIYMAESLSQYTGYSIHQVYKLMDMGAIFLFITLYFLFLRRWFSVELCLISVLFLSMLMPTTYAFHVFHPYDRMGVLLWLLFAWFVREDAFSICILLLIVSVLNKYDSVALPGLYFLAHVSKENYKTVVVKTGVMFLIGLCIYLGLKVLFPGGDMSRNITETVARNLSELSRLNISYPPILAFSIPMVLSFIGWKGIDQFQRAALLFAFCVLMGPLFLLTNFEEVRAEFALLIYMTPAALVGLKFLINSHHDKRVCC